MSASTGTWVLLRDRERDLACIREEWNEDAAPAPDALFALLSKSAVRNLPARMTEIATRFGAAVYLSAHSMTDAFECHYWCEGRESRALQFTTDCGWYAVRGAPLPWERNLILTDEKLHRALLDCETADEKQALQTMWAQALQQGSLHPRVDAMLLYNLVQTAMQLEFCD